MRVAPATGASSVAVVILRAADVAAVVVAGLVAVVAVVAAAAAVHAVVAGVALSAVVAVFSRPFCWCGLSTVVDDDCSCNASFIVALFRHRS